MEIKETGDGLRAIQEAIAFFNSNRVMVGIPDGGGGGDEMSNVALAYIHSNGSPKHNIPARPFLEPAIAQAAGKIAERMKASAIQAIEGNMDAARKELDKAGMYGENAAKDYLGSGALAPNAEITIHGGWMRSKVKKISGTYKRGKKKGQPYSVGAPFYVKGKNSAAPLIDTGSLRSSITHVIEKR